MRTVNFLTILFFTCIASFPVRAYSATEFYAGGVRYASFDDYKKARIVAEKTQMNGTVDDTHLKSASNDKEMIVDSAPIYAQPAMPGVVPVADPVAVPVAVPEALRKAGAEAGVGEGINAFEQTQDKPIPRIAIDSQALELHLKALVDGHKEPVIVMSQNGKLRVMSAKEAGQ